MAEQALTPPIPIGSPGVERSPTSEPPKADSGAYREVALKYFDHASQEILERVKLRDNLLIVYLAGVAALAGYAAGSTPGSPGMLENIKQSQIAQALLIIFPFLAAGAASALAHHQEVIGSFAEYMATDLMKALQVEGHPELPAWEASAAFRHFAERALTTLWYTQALLLAGPWIMVAALNYPYFGANPQPKDYLVVPGAAITAFTVWRLWATRAFRMAAIARTGVVLGPVYIASNGSISETPKDPTEEGQEPSAR